MEVVESGELMDVSLGASLASSDNRVKTKLNWDYISVMRGGRHTCCGAPFSSLSATTPSLPASCCRHSAMAMARQRVSGSQQAAGAMGPVRLPTPGYGHHMETFASRP